MSMEKQPVQPGLPPGAIDRVARTGPSRISVVDYTTRDVTVKEDETISAKITLVNEAGASDYSTGRVGKAEFPKLDSRVRSAITIARRLQDPLAEMAKLRPQAIGVGPYQRDVDKKLWPAARMSVKVQLTYLRSN